MQPIPFGCGMVKFQLHRNKSGLNRLNPLFILYLELVGSEKIPLLYARKRNLQKNATYIITMEKNAI
jgi:hypothetical protein